MKSSAILLYSYPDYGRLMCLERAIPERRRCSSSNICVHLVLMWQMIFSLRMHGIFGIHSSGQTITIWKMAFMKWQSTLDCSSAISSWMRVLLFINGYWALKLEIEKIFQPKTASHILKLREAFLGQTIFERSDVMKVIDIKSSRASDLLKEIAEHGIIDTVSGHGKGRYRFRHQEGWDDGITDLFP